MKCSILVTTRGSELSIFYRDKIEEVVDRSNKDFMLVDVGKNMANQKEWLNENEGLQRSLEILQVKQKIKTQKEARMQLSAEGLLHDSGLVAPGMS